MLALLTSTADNRWYLRPQQDESQKSGVGQSDSKPANQPASQSVSHPLHQYRSFTSPLTSRLLRSLSSAFLICRSPYTLSVSIHAYSVRATSTR
ncbi:hypothetical protein E2C01_023972 [Portunus trituberculatus]|uniref:Uncharacterized protein n=1 Tax=Portunus trituberculatus TaxID=210409 RepID=A0A5B7E9H1_PORTR|nr:hypothetical protein [Portunus trituberculatus]